MQKKSGQWLIPVLLAAGAAIAIWYYGYRTPAESPAPAAAPPSRSEPAPEGPLHPVEPAPEPVAGERPELVPLPPLDQSDQYLRLEIVDILGTPIDALLTNTGIVEKIVATVDNLPRAHVAERIRPLGRLNGPFLVDAQDDSGEYWIDSGNYQRYNEVVNLVATADLQRLADLYRRFYPLFQRAYEGLGYPDAYFNDRLVEVIDHLLETPVVGDPIALVRPNVLYEYRDPKLEALSAGQKLLLRMGTDNAARVKETLGKFRRLVTAM